MKKVFAALVFLPLIGCSVGGVELTKEAVFCESDGQKFAPGEHVALTDGCNSCVCSTDGELENCTEKDCGEVVGLANPAAVKCSVDGFKYEIRTADDGSQSGVCIDEENKECDAWAYFRTECALGPTPAVDDEIAAENSGEETPVDTTEESAEN